MKIFRPYINKATLIAGGIIIGLAVAIRFLWLDADPPPYFYNTGQALLTDPYNVIYYARNKILFGEWDIFGYDRWIVFKYSLSSIFAYLSFMAGGVSRITANLSAVILSLAGLGFYIAGQSRHSRRAAFITAILLLTNMTLMVYGRYPFLENGMILFCGLLYMIFQRYYPQRRVIPIAGFILALAIISGKLFAFVLAVPIGLVILVENRQEFFRELGVFLISLIISLAVISVLFYGSAIGVVYNYLSEQTVGMYGFPDSLKSPLNFLERYVTFAGDSRFFNFSPFFLTLGLLSILGLIFSTNLKARLRADRALCFNLGWFLAGFFLLMVVNYRPLRYQLFLLLPLAGIISSMATRSDEKPSVAKTGWLRAVFTLLLIWYLIVQAAVTIYLRLDGTLLEYTVCWYLFIPAVLSTGLILWRRNITLRGLFFRNYLFMILIILAVIQQGWWLGRWYETKSYCLKQAGEDVARYAGDGAVIAGPYAQAVTIDNNLKSFVYMFGLANKEPDLFARFPITHLAMDISNWDKAVGDYPYLLKSSRVAQYWIRDIELSLIRVYGAVPSPPGCHYELTDYEKAQEFYIRAGDPDSIYYYTSRFYAVHPKSKAGLKLLGNYYMAKGAVSSGFSMIDRLIALYPDDFSTYFDKGRANYLFYLTNGTPQFLKEADRYFGLATERNPYIEKDIEYAKRHADSLVNRRR
nr:hypothetical protein [candidate division Zixibacteria bacterium]